MVCDRHRTLVWPRKSGSWTMVVMNADGSRRPVKVRVDVAATLSALPWLAAVSPRGTITVGRQVAVWLTL